MSPQSRSSFGTIRQLKSSGRWQALVPGPDGRRHPAPDTFTTERKAMLWLESERLLVHSPGWLPPKQRHAAAEAARPPLLRDYAPIWLDSRPRPLAATTRQDYERLLDGLILPILGDRRLDEITEVGVRNWHMAVETGPRRRQSAYALLKSILKTATMEKLIRESPCVILNTDRVRRQHKVVPATLEELAVMVEAMPERLRLMVLIAAWCSLRQGEIQELRRGDLDLDPENPRIIVRRSVARIKGQPRLVKGPKSEAGNREVSIPPHLLPAFHEHVRRVPLGRHAPLFVGQNGDTISKSTLQSNWEKARAAAGRDDLRWHDLRHTGATLAAMTGATLAQLMRRLGHSTVGAAMIYQHAAQDGDKIIAAALSAMAQPATVTSISEVPSASFPST